MTRAKLVTRGGLVVDHVEIPPFIEAPEVVVYGSRLFILDPCDHARYREGFAWHVTPPGTSTPRKTEAHPG